MKLLPIINIIIFYILPFIFLVAVSYLLYKTIRFIFFKNKHKHGKRFSLKPAFAIIVIVIAPILYVIGIFYSGFVVCQNEEQSRIFSPDGKYEALFKSRNCGATSSYDTWIELKDKEGEKTKLFYNFTYPKDFSLSWLSNTKLQVSYTNNFCPALGLSGTQIKPGVKTWKDIEIIYDDHCTKN